jgi:hypothetical protein
LLYEEALKMAQESGFVDIALAAAKRVLHPPLSICQGAPLFYELIINNHLELTINPKKPVRGVKAFQTDLCVFESKKGKIKIPRVVLEFKTKITTHDVITYSAKARRHKQVYPYLRYGIVASALSSVPSRFFVHNEWLDFFAALDGKDPADLSAFFSSLLTAEVRTSQTLEKLAFEKYKPRFFRTEITIDAHEVGSEHGLVSKRVQRRATALPSSSGK